jgi:hypothetical protein
VLAPHQCGLHVERLRSLYAPAWSLAVLVFAGELQGDRAGARAGPRAQRLANADSARGLVKARVILVTTSAPPSKEVERTREDSWPHGLSLDTLRLGLARLLAGAKPRDQLGDVCELLLEIALVVLQPLENVLAVVPATEPMMVSSTSVVHRHLPS